jgi:hypothetical protein
MGQSAKEQYSQKISNPHNYHISKVILPHLLNRAAHLKRRTIQQYNLNQSGMHGVIIYQFIAVVNRSKCVKLSLWAISTTGNVIGRG